MTNIRPVPEPSEDYDHWPSLSDLTDEPESFVVRDRRTWDRMAMVSEGFRYIESSAPMVTGGVTRFSGDNSSYDSAREYWAKHGEKRGHQIEWHGYSGAYFHTHHCWCRGVAVTRSVPMGWLSKREMSREPRYLNSAGYQVGLKIAQWTTSRNWVATCQIVMVAAALILLGLTVFGP